MQKSESMEKQESKEPKSTEKFSLIKNRPAELENIIVELAKQNNTPAKIGLILRDKYSIPKVRLLNKKITKILKEAKINYPMEKEIVSRKIEKLKLHIKNNKYDHTAKRSLAKKLWFVYNFNKE